MYPYPNEMHTFQAASKLLALIRGEDGTRADYFHCGYVLEGFALKQIMGEPEGTLVAAKEPLNPEETLERVMAACDPNSEIASIVGLPPGFWRMVWDLAKKIIDELLSQPTRS